MKHFKWDKKYLYWGITAFCVIAAAIVFYMLLNHLSGLRAALGALGKILSPFVWGLVIAYLLYPLMKIYQRGLFTPLAKLLYKRSSKAETAVPKLARGLAVFFAIISLLIIIAGMIWLVGPQLYVSLESIVVKSQTYVETVDEWIAGVLRDYPEIEAAVSSLFGDISDGIVSFAADNLMPQIKSILSNVTNGVYGVFKGIYNALIGIVVSIYVLASRETFAAHGKKLLYSVFSLEASEKILAAIAFVDKVFMGFISGKILDSLIIGIMCYVGCVLLHIEYAVLASVIVGVTNVIPFFGPLFGMIFAAPIIFMESPLHALIFLVFVILLQQFDGNFLGPKILGNSVGIGGFWVLFSIIVGSGLFGFAGMLLGVPVFVVIYTFFKNLVNKKLLRSDLPVDSEIYMKTDHIDPATGQPVEFAPAPRRSEVRRERKLQRLLNREQKKTGTAQSAVPESDERDNVPEENAEAKSAQR